MKGKRVLSIVVLGLLLAVGAAHAKKGSDQRGNPHEVQLGPRPFYLIDEMTPGPLKDELERCEKGPFKVSDFSIGHRGAPLQFPEHTKESYVAAARMGAGILECDVTFTADKELVCRHAQCDLHTTTDIVARPDLRDKCKVPPMFGGDNLINGPQVQCCASDLTLAEFKSLCGKMDASNPGAGMVEEYLGGTANYRTDLYMTCGTVLSHKESIELFDSLGRKFIPELKSGAETDIAAVFGSQEAYAQRLVDDYEEAGIRPRKVYPQSFNLSDVRYWVDNEPAYGEQAVYLISENPADRLAGNPSVINDEPPPQSHFADVKDMGINIVAPPMPVLLTVEGGKIVPSAWAKRAKAADLEIIAWTTERSGRIVEDVLEGRGTFYYQTTLDALANDGDILTTIDVLAEKVGVIGLFSDWPATTTYYANCKLEERGRRDRDHDDDDDDDD